jgi:cysteine desulfurase
MGRIYLDWNATAPIRAEALARMVETLPLTGNPSSVHQEGRAARNVVELARRDIARLVNAPETCVTFTSGGTEAIATALTPRWLIAGEKTSLSQALIGASEHAAVLAGGRFPEGKRTRLPVGRDGLLDLADLAQRLAATPGPALVAVQAANNETGVLQPIAEIASIAHAHGAILVCDAVQAAGKIPLDLVALEADALILSSHKLGGPQGTGALVLRSEQTAPAEPLILGGGQEMGRRAGTEAVAAISGFGIAASFAAIELDEMAARLLALRDMLEAEVLRRVPDAVIFGREAQRLPNTTLIGLDGAPAATLLMALDLSGFAVSSGSACSSGKVKRSHVLDAMGIERSLAESAIRVSLGRDTTEADLLSFTEGFEKAAKCLYRRANAA